MTSANAYAYVAFSTVVSAVFVHLCEPVMTPELFTQLGFDLHCCDRCNTAQCTRRTKFPYQFCEGQMSSSKPRGVVWAADSCDDDNKMSACCSSGTCATATSRATSDLESLISPQAPASDCCSDGSCGRPAVSTPVDPCAKGCCPPVREEVPRKCGVVPAKIATQIVQPATPNADPCCSKGACGSTKGASFAKVKCSVATLISRV